MPWSSSTSASHSQPKVASSDLGLAVEPAQQRDERVGVVGDPAREQFAAVLVQRRDMRALAMQVDADRIHPRASFVPGLNLTPEA
jgi:hypothetical protein